jgi:hypothetical protein
MDKIQTFEQFLSTSSAQFSIWNFSLNLLLTALLAYLLGLLYYRYGDSLSNRKSFGRNFVILAVTTMIIISIVKSSLALSLGLVGALSIVRFRSAIKEPEELSYLFLNIAIGLGFGANQRIATIIGFSFLAIYLISKKVLYKKGAYETQNLILTLNIANPDKDQLIGVIDILRQNTKNIDLKRFDEDESTLEASFIIEVDDFEELNNAKITLQRSYKGITISLMDNNLAI